MTSTTAAQGSRNCVSCGRAIQWDANVCPYCGHDYRTQFMPVAPPRTGRARTGAVLILVAGLLAIIMGLLFIAISTIDFESQGATFPEGVTQKEVQDVLVVYGTVSVILGVIGIIGGVLGLQRRNFGLVIAGGVTSLIGIGFVVGAILAIIGLILVAMSRHEFEPAPMAQASYHLR